MKRGLAFIFASLLSIPQAFAANPGDNPQREFVTSCTYGVFAGTLVGAASLAFTKRPGDNLNRVARGASLGLYTGILLGLYVIYIVPGMEKGGEDEDPVAQAANLPFLVSPSFTADNRLDGVHAEWRILSF